MSDQGEQQRLELDDLSRFSGIVEMSKSSSFIDMMAMIDGLVSEAHEAMLGCLSMDLQVRFGFEMRYQQRIAMQREIKNWIESAQRGHEEILETMRQELQAASQRGETNL